MLTRIKKRDGRDVPFDPNKITEAIYKAAQSVGGSDREMAMELTLDVLRLLKQKYNGNTCGVEEVQDMVEKVLIERGHAKTAKAYILYRSKRSRIREGKSELMDSVQDILVETSRDNANVSNSPAAKMLQIASAASKAYYLTRLIPETMSQAHLRGDIHIHDLDYYGKTLNCVQIPLGRLLRAGFHNGHGYIRPPKRPGSATALAAIILQSSQNDMFGGQSFAFFDRDMAPYVKNIPEDEVYQAMEAFIFNLNSMHSLPGDERFWLYDRVTDKTETISMSAFHEKFEFGRYMALSLNRLTGITEWKTITNSFKHHNLNRILKVELEGGQTVSVTDNHSIMTIHEDGTIGTSIPELLHAAIVPGRFELSSRRHMYDMSPYPVSRRYPIDAIELDENLARFFGCYVAGVSSDRAELSVRQYDKQDEGYVTDILKTIHPDFYAELRIDQKGNRRDLVCKVGKRFAAFVREVCGAGTSTKRVPPELFLASRSIIQAFMEGFFRTGSVSGNSGSLETFTDSKELRDGIGLLLSQIGIASSFCLSEVLEQEQLAVRGYLIRVNRDDFNIEQSGAGENTTCAYEYLRKIITDFCGMDYLADFAGQIDYEQLQKWHKDLLSRVLTSQEICRLEEIAGIKPENLVLEEMSLLELAPNVLSTRLFIAGEIEAVLSCQQANELLKRNQELQVLLNTLERAMNLKPVRIRSIMERKMERFVYDISVAENENFLSAEGIFVHNSRAGAQVPFSSLNIGTETSPEGRAVTRNFLLAYEKGLGKGENPIFPNVIFRIKKGVNFDPQDPNYDLFKLAIRVAARRLNPTFSFMDSSYNKPYGSDVSYMGCRTRVISNINGPAVTEGRGNLSFTTINLPRIAIRAERNMMKFYQQLDETIDLVCEQLFHRFQVQAAIKVKDMPFLMEQGIYFESENLKRDDTIASAIKHGTLSVGFIGLAETLVSLMGSHHGENDEAQLLGEEIVAFMRGKADRAIDKYKLNFTLIATPAEGLAGRFVRFDRKEYGIIPGVTDREYYSNSFHIPVSFPIDAHEKIRREGVYHKYTNAGHISYVEFDAPPIHNIQAVEDILRCMAESDIGYAGINFPVDFCDSCGHFGVISSENCPACNSDTIRRVRRITGYLSTIDRFNDPKQAELRNRITHFL